MPGRTSLFLLEKWYIYLKLLQASQIDYCPLQNAVLEGQLCRGSCWTVIGGQTFGFSAVQLSTCQLLIGVSGPCWCFQRHLEWQQASEPSAGGSWLAKYSLWNFQILREQKKYFCHPLNVTTSNQVVKAKTFFSLIFPGIDVRFSFP